MLKLNIQFWVEIVDVVMSDEIFLISIWVAVGQLATY
jgi:hypothetical protein